MVRKKQVKLKCYVLLISRYFAKDNQKAGQPTGFLEKIESGEKRRFGFRGLQSVVWR